MVSEWHFKPFLQTDQAWSLDQMTEINPGELAVELEPTLDHLFGFLRNCSAALIRQFL